MLTSHWPSEMSHFTILIFVFTVFLFCVLTFISFNHLVLFVKFDVLVYFCWCLACAFAAERLMSCISLSFTPECRTWTLITFGGIVPMSAGTWLRPTGFYTRSCVPSVQPRSTIWTIFCMAVHGGRTLAFSL